MGKKLMMAAALLAALAVPAVSRAHEGHSEKVIGTISSVSGSNLMVKTTAGKTVMVMLDAKTTVTRGKTKVDATALKVGDRVVATGPEEKEMIMATSVQLAAAPATPSPTTAKK